jgi:ribosomal protein S18 acetylase RimI-like enzyme
MPETPVVAVTEADVAQLAVVLARAFQDDPAFSWAVTSAARRTRSGPRYFTLMLGQYLPKGEVWMTADRQAVAIWAPPDRWQASITSLFPLAPTMIRACGTNIFRAVRMLNGMEKVHRKREEPHYYLPFIATDPAARGRGHGGALLGSMLDRCDAEGRPAYLESSSMRNQALYHRHGFTVVGEEQRWPAGGPPWWPMWRPPRG